MSCNHNTHYSDTHCFPVRYFECFNIMTLAFFTLSLFELDAVKLFISELAFVNNKFLHAGIFYELTRTKTAQPLSLPTPDDIGIPVTIYKGPDLSYQDKGLEKHTSLVYTLSCFNVEGNFLYMLCSNIKGIH